MVLAAGNFLNAVSMSLETAAGPIGPLYLVYLTSFCSFDYPIVLTVALMLQYFVRLSVCRL